MNSMAVCNTRHVSPFLARFAGTLTSGGGSPRSGWPSPSQIGRLEVLPSKGRYVHVMIKYFDTLICTCLEEHKTHLMIEVGNTQDISSSHSDGAGDAGQAGKISNMFY